MKGRLGARVIRIPANQTPFDQTKGHFVDAEYYDNFATASEESIGKPSGTLLSAWEEIKELDNEDLWKFLEKKRKNEEATIWCIKVTLLDGLTAYRLWRSRGLDHQTWAVPESGEENESCSCSEEVSSNSIPSEVQPNLAPKRMQDGAGSVVEPLEEVDLSDDPNVKKPISISM